MLVKKFLYLPNKLIPRPHTTSAVLLYMQTDKLSSASPLLVSRWMSDGAASQVPHSCDQPVHQLYLLIHI